MVVAIQADGRANGNLVTGLSNISVVLNGKAFSGNGSLRSAAFDRGNYRVCSHAVAAPILTGVVADAGD